MAAARPLVITVPNTAMPTVEPTLRKNWVDAVATPRSARSTAFCTTSVYCCIAMPRPTPSTTIATVSSVWLEVHVSRVSSHMPAPMMTTPAIMIALYRPVRVMTRPDTMPMHDEAEHQRHEDEAGVRGVDPEHPLGVDRDVDDRAEHHHRDREGSRRCSR